MGERILVVGKGAREHALANSLAKAGREVLILGANQKIIKDFECLSSPSNGIKGVLEIALKLAPDLVVIGPEDFLAEGLVDALQEQGLLAFGPSKKAAMIESSKIFMKNICQKAKVTTAAFNKFADIKPALDYLSKLKQEKIVIKADGLCSGKGVMVCSSKLEAKSYLEYLYLDNGLAKLGLRSSEIIIEDFLAGHEVSVFAISDGFDLAFFSPMQDYKKLLDGDQGPNTGGMGAVGPLGKDEYERSSFLSQLKEQVFLPVLKQLRQEGALFSGLLYAGLMLCQGRIHVLEFNARFGDPETQALLFGTNADIYPLLKAIAVNDEIDFDSWQSALLKMNSTVAVVLASLGYPKNPGLCEDLILPKICSPDTKLFFGANSGRVITAVARDKSIEIAKTKVYELVSQIKFKGMQYRLDIGANLSPLKLL